MCSTSSLIFCLSNVAPAEVVGKRVLEVGSLNVNGSVRAVLEHWGPSEYIGIDAVDGEGVDRVADITALSDIFPHGHFDVVISTEVLEHVRDWRAAIYNMKSIAAPGAILIITTRSRGFPYHPHPEDFWRYERSDLAAIFSDFLIDQLQSDPAEPGIFMRARKPTNFVENNIADHLLFNMLTGSLAPRIEDANFRTARYRWLVYRMKATRIARNIWQTALPQVR